MDPEVVAAIITGAVAAVTLPATFITGRWQLRAAVRNAEETGRAGLAQAEATYSAALDAVRAEASAAHVQWRRGIQQEAYANFLLSSHRCTELAQMIRSKPDVSTEMAEQRKAELNGARTALKAALQVVVLEGTDSVARQARSVVALTLDVVAMDERGGDIWHVWTIFARRHEEAVRSFVPDPDNPDVDPAGSLEHDLLAAVATLKAAVTSHPHPIDYRHVKEEDRPQEVREAEDMLTAALNAFPVLTIAHDHRQALVDLAFGCEPTSKESFQRELQNLTDAQASFIQAARADLRDSPLHS